MTREQLLAELKSIQEDIHAIEGRGWRPSKELLNRRKELEALLVKK